MVRRAVGTVQCGAAVCIVGVRSVINIDNNKGKFIFRRWKINLNVGAVNLYI